MPQPSHTRRAWRDGLSVAIPTGMYGVSFGALSVASGLDVAQTCVLSLLMFSGGSQFAFIGVISGGGTMAAAIASSFILASRNLLYGVSMHRALSPAPGAKPFAAHLTIDESTAVALAQPTQAARRTGFWVTGVGIFVFWNLATLGGALLGNVLGDVRMWGLDAAAAAAFVGLLWPRLRSRQAVAVGIASAVVATVLIPLVPPGIPVLVSLLVALIVGYWNLLGARTGEEP